MPSGWDHEKVMLALAMRGEKVSNLEIVDVYIQLYSQKPNVATIYTSTSPFTKNGEWQVMLRESHKNFDASKISPKEPFLEVVGNYKDWFKYKVTDWNAFAVKLGLSFGAKDTEE